MSSKKIMNQKGFSLIELLAAVTILGILTVIAIGSVTKVLESARKEFYKSQEENMVIAAQSYFQHNKKQLPKSIGQEMKVSLITLQQGKYIDTVKDRNDKACDNAVSYVEVVKNAQNAYKYKVYLKCGTEYETKLNERANQPEITIDMPPADKYNEIKNVKAKITMKGSKTDPDVKLASYSYVVLVAKYQSGVALEDLNYQEVANSGSVQVRTKFRERTMILDEYLPAVIKIQVTVINEDGEKATKTSTAVNLSDLVGPLCPSRTDPEYANLVKGENTDWANTTIPKTITMVCKDKANGSECARPYYTQEFSEETETGEIFLYDKNGNKSKCIVNVYTDLTPPTLTINVKDATGNIIKTVSTTPSQLNQTLNTGWLSGTRYKEGVTIEYSVSDTSELKSISVKRNEKGLKANDSKVSTYKTPTVTNLVGLKEKTGVIETLKGASDNGYNKYFITLTDAAGKTSTVDLTVPYDVTAPTVTLLNSSNGAWTNQNVKITADHSDAISGISKVEYSHDNSTWLTSNWDTTSTSAKTTGTWTGERNNKFYVKVTDVAGNTTVKDTSIKIDKTAPSLTITNPSNGNWTNQNIKITAEHSDAASGLSKLVYGYDNKTWTDWAMSSTTKTEGTWKAERNNTLYVKVTDVAGNAATKNTTVKIDKTVPTCSISLDGTEGKNGWYKSNIAVKLTPSDNASGVSGKTLTTSTTASYGSTVTGTQTSDTVGTKWYGYIKDNAGNTGKCSKTVYKDTKAPYVVDNGSYDAGKCKSFKNDGNTVIHRIKMIYQDDTSGITDLFYKYEYSDSTPDTDFSEDSLGLRRSNTIVISRNSNGHYKKIRQDYNLTTMADAWFKFKIVDRAGNSRVTGSYKANYDGSASSSNSGKYCRKVFPTGGSYATARSNYLKKCGDNSTNETQCYIIKD